MMSSDPIDRLVNVPPNQYADALAVLFVNSAKMPTTNVTSANERMILVEIINEDREARAVIKTIHNQFENYLKEKFKPHVDQLEKDPSKADYAVKQLSELLKNLTIGSNDENNLFTLQDKNWRFGQTALRINKALSKQEQQSKNLTRKGLELLAKPELQIIEPTEQLTVCRNCLNFEQIMVTHHWRDSKCTKCGNDSLSVRIYTLDEEYEKHKKNNKDLPLFIAKRINRKIKNSAIPSKKLEEFGISSVKGDIDVYINKIQTGIECKLWVAESKSTDDQLNSYVKLVLDNLKKYQKVGIKNLIVVTNLDKDDAERMHKLLLSSLGDQTSLKVIHNSVPELIRMIDDLSEKICS